LELGHRDRFEVAANWKVVIENYSENYHTPFLHSQLPTAGYEYPMREAGPIVFAWDRPLAPRDASEEALATSAPGEPGWERVGECVAPESFNNGGYVTLFPNTMISMFGGFAAPMRLTPTGPASTIVERDYLWAPELDAERRARDLAATQEVVAQDLEICEAIQRTYAGGISAHGVLSTEHERGVAHVHRLLVEALAREV
jgi:Rieske 2Fe-2S family protein